ncbi:PQQ-dependent sugar dehydrogenase [bacterium]|nr:PQQ-dependent sugar dehydrogenase [bacterium]
MPQPLANLTLSRELVATGFEQPVFATGEGGRLYVVDQVGRIEVLGGAGRSVFLDITDRVSFGGERGLLGLAFHPDFDQNGRFFVDYTGRGDGHTVIEEHTVGGGDRVLLTISQPAANHNAGMIAFGPDGYLYIALGDGGGADDRYGNGQDPATLLGTILRIDVDSGDPYGIPPENPWADGSGPGAPEVWIYGLRNPWRFSFDGDDLFIGDVGQNEWEEVSIVNRLSRGLNLGWPIIEGNSCFALSDCNPGAFTLPALVYPHQGGACSITGGYVYRGSAIPGLGSAYFYGDFCSGAISSFRLDGEGPYELRDWPSLSTPGLTSFGVDESGEMYMSSTDGNLYRIVEG